MILPGNDPTDETRVRWKTKPIERRPLHVPSSTMQQGTLECWVDIMQPAVASSFPADKVALPPTQLLEVRLVIWKAKDVPPQVRQPPPSLPPFSIPPCPALPVLTVLLSPPLLFYPLLGLI